MKSLHFKWFLFLFLFFSAIILLSYILFLFKKTNEHDGNEINHFDFIKKNNHEKIKKSIQDIHKSTLIKKKNQKECGIGWELQNDECVRSFSLFNAIESSFQDFKQNKCKNFFEFSCGNFNKDPFNVGKDSTFSYIHSTSTNAMKTITDSIISSVSPEQSKISAFYHSCIHHNEALDIHHSSTLKSLLNFIDNNLITTQDLPKIWGALQLFDTILPIELSFELNPFDSSSLIPMIQQSGLFDEQDFISTQDHLNDISERLQLLYTQPVALNWAKQIVSIEKDIQRNFHEYKYTNLVDYLRSGKAREDVVLDWKSYFSKLSFNITAFIEAANPSIDGKSPWVSTLNTKPLWCYSKIFIEKLPNIINQYPAQTWAVYTKHAILFHINNGDSAPQTDPEQHYAYHKQYDYRYSLPWLQPRKFLMRGSQFNLTKETTCLSLTEAYLPIVLDNYYVNTYLSPSIRNMASKIAHSIKESYVLFLNRRDNFAYLSHEDRHALIKKIQSVKIQIGVPSVWPIDRSTLYVDPESYIESILSIRKYHIEKNYRFFIQHVNYAAEVNADSLFEGLVSNANAYYQHQFNTVMLTSGLLQPPVFSVSYDRVSLYSRFGVLIAHELSHSIDEIGVLFDTTGTYNPILTEDGLNLYKEKTKCFIKQYSILTENGNIHDGKKTLNENIADNAAIKIAFVAFMESGDSPPTKEEQQQFFVSYSQLYCESISKNQEQFLITHRSHSINSLRVNNIVNQLFEFYDLWNCNQRNQNSNFNFEDYCSIF